MRTGEMEIIRVILAAQFIINIHSVEKYITIGNEFYSNDLSLNLIAYQLPLSVFFQTSFKLVI